MKLVIYGKKRDEVTGLAEKAGFSLVDKDADVIASYGGDGTLMKCEHEFPSIKKFVLKGSKICKKSAPYKNEEILRKIIKGDFTVAKELKLEAKSKNKKFLALNEIVVHNKNPRKAIRYEVYVNGKKIGGEIIGDGLIISTPFGSTGYYRSITDSIFEVGMGIAFNNSTEQSDHMVIRESSKVLIKVIRGIAIVYADNCKDEIELADGEQVEICVSKKRALILQPK